MGKSAYAIQNDPSETATEAVSPEVKAPKLEAVTGQSVEPATERKTGPQATESVTFVGEPVDLVPHDEIFAAQVQSAMDEVIRPETGLCSPRKRVLVCRTALTSNKKDAKKLHRAYQVGWPLNRGPVDKGDAGTYKPAQIRVQGTEYVVALSGALEGWRHVVRAVAISLCMIEAGSNNSGASQHKMRLGPGMNEGGFNRNTISKVFRSSPEIDRIAGLCQTAYGDIKAPKLLNETTGKGSEAWEHKKRPMCFKADRETTVCWMNASMVKANGAHFGVVYVKPEDDDAFKTWTQV